MNSNCGKERGSMLMECVLVLPVQLLLVMAVVQFAQIWTARYVTSYAAYCAARATLSTNPANHQSAAESAARRVCAWANLADLPERLMSSRAPDDHEGELLVPGWGAIPNSASIDRRVDVVLGFMDQAADFKGRSSGVTAATVKFRFPLVTPLAGSMISWLAKHGSGASGDSTAEYRLVSGWTGEAEILEDERSRIARSSQKDGSVKMDYMEQGVFPYIELTETCVLPLPYSTSQLPYSGVL